MNWSREGGGSVPEQKGCTSHEPCFGGKMSEHVQSRRKEGDGVEGGDGLGARGIGRGAGCMRDRVMQKRGFL